MQFLKSKLEVLEKELMTEREHRKRVRGGFTASASNARCSKLAGCLAGAAAAAARSCPTCLAAAPQVEEDLTMLRTGTLSNASTASRPGTPAMKVRRIGLGQAM